MGVLEKVNRRKALAPVEPAELPLDSILMSDCVAAMRSLPAKSARCSTSPW